MTIDTLEYMRRLEAAGVDRTQAEAHARAVGELVSSQTATRADLQAATLRLEAKFDRLEVKFDRMEPATRREIAEVEMRLIKYMVAQTGAIVGLVLAFGGLLLRFAR